MAELRPGKEKEPRVRIAEALEKIAAILEKKSQAAPVIKSSSRK